MSGIDQETFDKILKHQLVFITTISKPNDFNTTDVNSLGVNPKHISSVEFEEHGDMIVLNMTNGDKYQVLVNREVMRKYFEA